MSGDGLKASFVEGIIAETDKCLIARTIVDVQKGFLYVGVQYRTQEILRLGLAVDE